jgi:putative ABC transport system permease protein
MLASYLLTLYRSLVKHRLFSALNILGLATGIAVFLVLSIAARHDLSYDRWLPNADRTFRVSGVMLIPGRPQELVAPVAGPTLPAMRADFPQIETGVRLLPREMAVRQGDQADFEQVVFADPNFFDVFDLPIASGSGPEALAQPTGVAISEAIARKYFGSTRAVGQRLTVTVDGKPHDYRVTAVMRDLPENTHLKADIVARMDPSVLSESLEYLEEWNATNYVTYVRLKRAEDAAAVQDGIKAFLQRRAGEPAEWMTLKLEALPDLHFSPAIMGTFKPGVDRRFITMLQVIALLTLALAVINYVNLSTARAALRAKEVALRKVMGATRGALMAQFLIEAVALTLGAGLIALALVELTLPFVNTALGQTLELNYLGPDSALVMVLLVSIAVGLVAGAYPALVISRFEPAAVLAAARAPGGGRTAAGVREILVVAQFAVSIALLIGMGVVFAQAEFVRRADVGFKRERLILIHQLHQPGLSERANPLLDAIRRVPGVESATISGRSPGNNTLSRSQTIRRNGLPDDRAPSIGWEMVDHDYFKTYGLRLVAGRAFSRANALDDMETIGRDRFFGGEDGELPAERRGLNIMLNETAARALEFARPADAAGKTVRTTDGIPLQVVGVVQDARYGSPREKVPPIMYVGQSDAVDMMGMPVIGVRYRGDPAVMMRQLRTAWGRVAPDAPFEAETVDAAMNGFYEPEERRSWLVTLGTVVATLIGCLGLYGLAAFSSERRTKEIGVRKVLGATTGDVFRLLVGQFLRPVVIANLIAWPIAFVVMREWLNGFDQHVGLSPVYFLGATVLALGVALLTVTAQALKVARADPGMALRSQ